MRERRVEPMEEEDEDGGAVCFIKASVTPQSTADRTRLSNRGVRYIDKGLSTYYVSRRRGGRGQG